MKSQLYCTFSHRRDLTLATGYIGSNYDLLNNRAYLFSDQEDRNTLFISYNVLRFRVDFLIENTIAIHRKKETNTLYTINAINLLICKLNNGILDKKYPVDWSRYSNCFLLTNKEELKRVDLVFEKILVFS